MSIKSIAQIEFETLLKTNEVLLQVIEDNDGLELKVELDKRNVHFFFNLGEQLTFAFSEHYQRVLESGDYFTIYDQQRDLAAKISGTKSKLIYLSCAPGFVHEVFIQDIHNLVHFEFEGFGVREYAVKPIGFDTDQLLAVFFNSVLPTSLKSVYYKAKVLELFSYLFDVSSNNLFEACPFLKEKDNVEKIKKARNILIDRMDEPPALKELAKEIGMNEYNLKVGFRNVYGLPPFRYLQEHKLSYSKSLLRAGQLQVAEIAFMVGYKSASHYIEAFRKKFGTTPRKYMVGNFNE